MKSTGVSIGVSTPRQELQSVKKGRTEVLALVGFNGKPTQGQWTMRNWVRFEPLSPEILEHMFRLCVPMARGQITPFVTAELLRKTHESLTLIKVPMNKGVAMEFEVPASPASSLRCHPAFWCASPWFWLLNSFHVLFLLASCNIWPGHRWLLLVRNHVYWLLVSLLMIIDDYWWLLMIIDD